MRDGLAAALAGIALITPLSGPSAQHDGHECSASPPELAGWSSRRPITAAGDASGIRAATLAIGSAVDATLGSTGDVRYPARPEKSGGPVSYGGLFDFTVDRPGTYRVALGSGAWIDVLKQTAPIASAAHGHGPDCSGIRKIVDFSLTPGRYTLQVAASAEPTLPLMIARLP